MNDLSPPHRPDSGHKGTFGRVLLIGGSRGMAGSIALSAMAALRSGSGLVSAAVPDRILETVAAFDPAVMTIPLPDQEPGVFAGSAAESLGSLDARWDAVGIGPGMTTGDGPARLLEHCIERRQTPLVIDADGLNILAEEMQSGLVLVDAGHLILTPHPGELERLTGVPAGDREGQIEAAEGLSKGSGATIVVKGAQTVVVDKDRRWTNSTGNAGMATGGSGDVLTGVITSLLGQGMTPFDAARLAVFQHGAAGDRLANKIGMAAITAGDLARELRIDRSVG